MVWALLAGAALAIPTTKLGETALDATATSSKMTAAALAEALFADKSQPCLFMCNYTSVQAAFNLEASALSEHCPELAHPELSTDEIDLTEVMLPAGVHLLTYGQSYMGEVFHFIRAAHKLMGLQASKEYLTGTEGMGGCTCAGYDFPGNNQYGRGMPVCGRWGPRV